MGNAECTIRHPDCFEATPSDLEAGRFLDRTANFIRMEKISGAAVGCGGTVTFKRQDGDGGDDEHSELYIYVNYQGKNVGTIEWRRNDLNLKYNYSWAPDSELMVDIREKATEEA